METRWKVFEKDTNYEVSDFGEVRAVGSHKRRKLRFDGNMYLRVNLRYEKTYSIHRMVAESFLHPITGKDYVNHKNNIPWDNRIENLEWCTAKENAEHSALIGAHYSGEQVHTVKLTEEQARHIKYVDTRTGAEIARELNVNKSTINKIRSEKSWKNI